MEPDSQVIEPRPAALEDMLGFHDEAYLHLLAEAERGEPNESWLAAGLGSEDCPVFHGLWNYVQHYVGGSLTGAELITAGTFDRVFHPAGGLHHAKPESASGFCYANDVVLAVQSLRKAGSRVAVVDIDAHHGDGTQEAFYRDADVLTISLHESGKSLFPWGGFPEEIGTGPGRGFNVNVPLPAGAYDELFVEAVERVVLPLVRRFAPDVLVVEVGGDVLAVDPMTHLSMTNNAIASVIEMLDEFTVPWLVVGGGGYHVEATVRAWTLVWSIMTHQPLHDDYAGLIGGAMTGLAELEGGDLRDPRRYVPQQTKDEIEAEFAQTLQTLRRLLDL